MFCVARCGTPFSCFHNQGRKEQNNLKIRKTWWCFYIQMANHGFLILLTTLVGIMSNENVLALTCSDGMNAYMIYSVCINIFLIYTWILNKVWVYGRLVLNFFVASNWIYSHSIIRPFRETVTMHEEFTTKNVAKMARHTRWKSWYRHGYSD